MGSGVQTRPKKLNDALRFVEHFYLDLIASAGYDNTLYIMLERGSWFAQYALRMNKH